MEIQIPDIPVMYVESPGGPQGSAEAFNQLEAALPTRRGRRFYATYWISTGRYQACVAIEPGDNPTTLGFATSTIPGGKYARSVLKDWAKHPWDIPGEFARLAEKYQDRIDRETDRPSIEFYKSQKELICLIPIQ